MDLHKFKSAVLSGTISGCITSVTFQPLEVLRTRLQQSSNLNKGLYQVLSDTYKTGGGIRVFWNGLTPSICRSVPVVAIYFTSIEILSSLKVKLHNEFITSFFIGATSRTIAGVSMFPLSLIKTHYESDMYRHENMVSAFKTIFKENGLRGLYKGLSPTLLRDINYSGIHYMIYSKLKSSFNDQVGNSKIIACCALLSSTFACFVTQPADVIRTRMQLQPLEYYSFNETMKKIYFQEGFISFFNGFIPRSTRRILITVFSWTIFEKVKIKLS
jgi:solute carrier family 25 protein 38